MDWFPDAAREPVVLIGAFAALIGMIWEFLISRYWRHETGSAYGTARWATRHDMAKGGLFGHEGIVVGRRGRKLLRLKTDKPLLMVAPNRSGKGVQLIGTLLEHPGSLVVCDVKGENACVTYRHRKEQLGQDCHVIDPWRITGLPHSRFNPLLMFDPLSPDLIDDATLISSSLIIGSGKENEPFWIPEADALVAGMTMHVITSQPPETRHLGTVREMLTRCDHKNERAFERLLNDMLRNPGARGMVQRAAQRLLQKSPRERSGVLSTAQSQTHILDSPRLIEALSASDIDLPNLKRKPTTIYLVLPANRLKTHGRWMRLMVSICLTAVTQDRAPARHPVLFALDEFASAIGRMEIIEAALTLLPGFGVQLYPILQDLSQLEDLYPKRWRSFLANAGVIQAFGVNDKGTADYLSAMLGTRTAILRQRQRGGAGKGGQNESYSAASRPLMMPHEILQMRPDKQLLLMPGRRPILAGKVRYYRDAEFRGLFDPNPMHRG